MASSSPSPETRHALWLQRRQLWLAAGFSVLTGLLALAPTWFMFEVYDRVVGSRSSLTLAMLLLLVLMVMAVMEVLDWSRIETLREAGAEFDRVLAPRVVESIHTAQLRQGQGLGVQPLSDLRTLSDAFHSPAFAAILQAPVTIVLLVLLFVIQPLLGWVSLAGALLQCALSWMNERATGQDMALAGRSEIQSRTFAENSLQQSEVIVAMGMEPHMRGRWQSMQQQTVALQARASDHAGLFQALGKWLQITLSSALLGVGAWLLLREELPGGAGMLIVGSVLGGRVLAPLVQLVSQWRSVIQVREAWSRLSGYLDKMPPSAPAMSLPSPSGRLQVESLSASATPGGPAVFRNLNFTLQPGEVLGVVGPSGSGKTTLARMLVGLWTPLSGHVRLDGADISTWNKLELGAHIGYVPQGFELIAGTLAENIAQFGEINEANVHASAEAAGVHEWIASLPLGYDTPLGDEGLRLSGGQLQRIALARALYGYPALLVLDEPNASLDEAGHAALTLALKACKDRGATVIVFTHLPSALAVADKMLVLNSGAQQAFGPRDEVLRQLQGKSSHVAAREEPRWKAS